MRHVPEFRIERIGQDASAADVRGLAALLVDAVDGGAGVSFLAITGVEGARAYGAVPPEGDPLLIETLGFEHRGDGEYRLLGSERSVRWAYDRPRGERARLGAGSVHHIAWACPDEDHLAWQERARAAGREVTEVRDRDYFKSIYFREPRGVLFEIATLSPGFAVDEDPEHLGEALRLPSRHEHLRERLERQLTPLDNPRAVV